MQMTEEALQHQNLYTVNVENIVAQFLIRCQVDLKHVAMNGINVIHARERGMVCMRISDPKITACIWASGKVVCIGAKRVEDAFIGSKKVARCLWRLGYNVKMSHYQIINVLCTCKLPFRIDLVGFTKEYSQNTSYDPEQQSGAIFRLNDLATTIKIHSTGSLTVTARAVSNAEKGVDTVYPLCLKFRQTVEPEILSSNLLQINRNTSGMPDRKRKLNFSSDHTAKKFHQQNSFL